MEEPDHCPSYMATGATLATQGKTVSARHTARAARNCREAARKTTAPLCALDWETVSVGGVSAIPVTTPTE